MKRTSFATAWRTGGVFDDATIAARLSRMPLGRFGELAEIAAVAAFSRQRRGQLRAGRRPGCQGWLDRRCNLTLWRRPGEAA